MTLIGKYNADSMHDKAINNTNDKFVAIRMLKKGAMKLEGLVIQNRFEEGDNFTASTFSAIVSKDGVESYMLEPKGPSTEQPNQNQRIPEGIYH